MISERKLLNILTRNIRQAKCGNVLPAQNPLHKKSLIDPKYVTDKNLEEIIGFYNFMKENKHLDFATFESLINRNKLKFAYLYKCNQSIYDFVETLYWNGPIYIAKEMSRQGKEIDYINNNIMPKK